MKELNSLIEFLIKNCWTKECCDCEDCIFKIIIKGDGENEL